MKNRIHADHLFRKMYGRLWSQIEIFFHGAFTSRRRNPFYPRWIGLFWCQKVSLWIVETGISNFEYIYLFFVQIWKFYLNFAFAYEFQWRRWMDPYWGGWWRFNCSSTWNLSSFYIGYKGKKSVHMPQFVWSNTGSILILL